jgi:hypothetical protein
MAVPGEVRALTRALSSRKELAASLTSSILATQAGLRIRIRIQSGQWIRIRNRIPDRIPDPDPGGQK